MAQLGLAMGGGALFGPWGFLAGSLLGAWLFGKDQKGPRLNDLSVTVSSQGIPIGIGYGTIVMPGNVIWKTDLVEHKRKTSAKGGPQIVEYYYTCSLAVCFANREAKHLLKLYIDNKLLFDVDASGVYAPTGEDAIINEYGIKFRFYTGSETQEPDPLIESIEGVGNVPAFRGCCYAVFEDINVSNFGNRVPSFQAAIAFGSAPAYPWVRSAMGATGTDHVFDHARGRMYSAWSNWVHVFDNNTNENISKKDVGPTGSTGPISIDPEGRFYVHGGVGNYSPIYQMDPDSLQSIRSMGRTSSGGGWDLISIQSKGVAVTLSGENCMVFASNQNGDITIYSRDKDHYLHANRRRPYGFASQFNYNYTWRRVSDYEYPIFPQLTGKVINSLCVDKDGVVWGAGGHSHSARSYLFKIQITLVPNPDWEAFPGTDKIGNFTIERIEMADPVTAMGGCIDHITYVPDDHSLILISTYSKRIAKWDIESRTFIGFIDDLIFFEQHNGVNLQNGYIGILTTGVQLAIVNVTTMQVEKVYSTSPEFGISFYGHSADWDSKTNSLYFIDFEGGIYYTYRLFLDRVTNGVESLDTVVEDICVRSGMVAADVDVTDLASVDVRGVSFSSNAHANQFIQSLMSAYLFIGVETDWKVKFTRLGTASVFTIMNDELGVSIKSGSNNSKLSLSFGNEEEIPYHVSITYLDETRDYEANEQHSSRSLDGTCSRERLSINLDLVLSDEEAKQLSEKWLLLGWNRRKSLSTSTFPRHMRIDPGDVGTLISDSESYSAYILESSLGANGVLKIDALIDDIDIFTSLASAYGGESDPQSIISPGYTELFIFDIPALRDADYNSGTGIVLYFGCGARSSSWKGALVLRSEDGYSFSKVAATLNSVTWGKATTALGDSSGWASWDPFKTVTIHLVSGSLSSATKLEVLNGANVAALKSGDGWEIFQFKNVTDNGDGTYTLGGGMTRGRRGTDTFTGGHAVGDTFILLDSEAVERYIAPNADYEQTRLFKPVTIGSEIEHSATNFGIVARAYYPYSPTFVKGARDGSNNLTITWKRRTRVGGMWNSTTGDVPLGEESETYEIDIILSDSVVRTIDATEETASYTAAQQTIDGISPGDPVTIKIYQTNLLVGRGFEKESTI